MYRYLVYLTGDRAAAEDLTAETFEKAFRSWRRFDPRRGSPRTWLCKIARSVAIDWFRAETRRRRREETYARDVPLIEEFGDGLPGPLRRRCTSCRRRSARSSRCASCSSSTGRAQPASRESARPRARRGSAARCGDSKRGWTMSANEMTVERLLRAHAPHAPEASARARARARSRRRVRSWSLPPRRLALVALPAALGARGRRGGRERDRRLRQSRRGRRSTARGVAATTVPTASRCAARPTDSAAPARPLQRTAASSRQPPRRASTSVAARSTPTPRSRSASPTPTRSRPRRRARRDRDVARRLREVGRLPHAEGRQRRRVHRAARPVAEREDGAHAARGSRHDRLAAALGRPICRASSRRSRRRSRSCAAASPRCARRSRDPALPDAQRVLLQIRLAESKRALAQRLNARKGTVVGRRDGAHLARHRHGEGDRARRPPRGGSAGCCTRRSASSRSRGSIAALCADRHQPVRARRRARLVLAAAVGRPAPHA